MILFWSSLSFEVVDLGHDWVPKKYVEGPSLPKDVVSGTVYTMPCRMDFSRTLVALFSQLSAQGARSMKA